MKAITHYTFSAGASVYALSELGLLSWHSIAIALWLSLAVNYSIDALGHSNAGTPSRTRLTHSVFTAPLWGASSHGPQSSYFRKCSLSIRSLQRYFRVVAEDPVCPGTPLPRQHDPGWRILLEEPDCNGAFEVRQRGAQHRLHLYRAGTLRIDYPAESSVAWTPISLSLVGSVAGFYLERREAEGGN